VIVRAISKAKSSIYVQAYGMTSPPIVNALIKAQSRGIKVRILLDKRNIKDKWSKMDSLIESGADVGIDKVSGIAHNKVMIIDKSRVITGSFNFTKSADTRNAENVIIINDANVAAQYLQNWLKRKSKNESNRGKKYVK
jgi:phospholipase D